MRRGGLQGDVRRFISAPATGQIAPLRRRRKKKRRPERYRDAADRSSPARAGAQNIGIPPLVMSMTRAPAGGVYLKSFSSSFGFTLTLDITVSAVWLPALSYNR